MKRFLVNMAGLCILCCMCISCSDEDYNMIVSEDTTFPFRSLTFTSQGETVPAKEIDPNNISIHFNEAEKFNEASVNADMIDGYTLVFPEDPSHLNLENTPVLNIKTPTNQIKKYWIKVSSNAMPIIDASKILVDGIDGSPVSASLSNLSLLFDREKMDQKSITIRFEEGALVEGATPPENLTFDFTESLVQTIDIMAGGKVRPYTLTLDLSSVIKKTPSQVGLADVTAQFVDPAQYPYINVFKTNQLRDLPVAGDYEWIDHDNWPWEYNFFTDTFFDAVGDWTTDRETTNVSGDFAIVTIDIKNAKARLVTNQTDANNTTIPGNQNALIVAGGRHVYAAARGWVEGGGAAHLYYDNGSLLDVLANWDDPSWIPSFRAGLGIDKNGKISFSNCYFNGSLSKGSGGSMMQLPYFNDDSHSLAGAQEWDVEQAVWGYALWPIRNGRALTKIELFNNDGCGVHSASYGRNWAGVCNDHVFYGLTYDNKIGIAVCMRPRGNASAYPASWASDPTGKGYTLMQAAWLLQQLGWKEVFNVANAQVQAYSIIVNGQSVIGEKDWETRYCLLIDGQNN
mgnify:CR=1 FL=1